MRKKKVPARYMRFCKKHEWTSSCLTDSEATYLPSDAIRCPEDIHIRPAREKGDMCRMPHNGFRRKWYTGQ